jgi:hypothetical protein
MTGDGTRPPRLSPGRTLKPSRSAPPRRRWFRRMPGTGTGSGGEAAQNGPFSSLLACRRSRRTAPWFGATPERLGVPPTGGATRRRRPLLVLRPPARASALAG